MESKTIKKYTHPGRPATGLLPKTHLTIIGLPEEIAFINKSIKERGFKTKSRFIVNLVLEYLNYEKK